MTQGARLDGAVFERVYAQTGNAAAAARAAGSTAKTSESQSVVGRRILKKALKNQGSSLEKIRLNRRHPVTPEGLATAAAEIYDMSIAAGEGFNGSTAVSALRLLAQVAQLLVEQHDVNLNTEPSEAIAAALRAAESQQDGS